MKSSSTYEKDIDSVAAASTNETAYALTTENQVVVGADEVQDDVFQYLRKMPFSPEIEWYNETSQKWVRLVVDKYDTSYNSDSNTHSMEITFSLPNLYTQF